MTDSTGQSSDQAIKKLKEEAAQAAADLIEDGMVVGLGSGSTATLLVAAVGRRVQTGLRLIGIPTSEQTADQARSLNIPLSTLGEHPHIDVDFDGADEVELNSLNLSKGGGGNLLREKLVAIASDRLVIIVDDRKLVSRLGERAPIAVEVVPFGWETTERRLKDMGGNPTLRHQSNGEIFITDGGHYILDCAFGPIASAIELAAKLDSVVGVVEHGLFIGMTSKVIIGGTAGVTSLDK
jgi:ribose 5-phosphate isomerase A